MLFSVSLALFAHACVHKQKKTRSGSGRSLLLSDVQIDPDRSLHLRMSYQNRNLVELRTGRKLLQVSSNSVLVREVVVVAQDGSGTFTTISDAVSAAPNKTNIKDGYFLIYIGAGVYEEYVSIAKSKRNIMMIGDGSNQTVTTGNHSVVDGWNTFNSATFGE